MRAGRSQGEIQPGRVIFFEPKHERLVIRSVGRSGFRFAHSSRRSAHEDPSKATASLTKPETDAFDEANAGAAAKTDGFEGEV